MDQGLISSPNRGSFNRLTATGIWFPTGEVSGFHLGNIDLTAMDEGISREKVPNHRDGAVTLAYDEVVSVAPVFSIKGKQFHTTILPLLYMGTREADDVQTNNPAATRTLTAALGRTFDIGVRAIRNSVVTVPISGYTAIPDLDYFIEENRGLIRFSSVAPGIANGDEVQIDYVRPSLRREVYTAFDQLNQSGNMLLFEFDGRIPEPLIEQLVPGTISRDKGAEGDPTKTNQWALRFALEGQPAILRAGSWDEILLDDSTVLEYA